MIFPSCVGAFIRERHCICRAKESDLAMAGNDDDEAGVVGPGPDRPDGGGTRQNSSSTLFTSVPRLAFSKPRPLAFLDRQNVDVKFALLSFEGT
jgi:hypothetical protein